MSARAPDRPRRLTGAALIAVVLGVAVFAPLLAPHDPAAQSIADRFRPPAWSAGGTWALPLGGDNLGRDIFSRPCRHSGIDRDRRAGGRARNRLTAECDQHALQFRTRSAKRVCHEFVGQMLLVVRYPEYFASLRPLVDTFNYNTRQ